MSSLQPRYRRLFTVAALLDESIQLFREHWITLALYSLIALAPSWVFLMAISITNVQLVNRFQGRVTAESFAAIAADVVVVLGLALLQGLMSLLWLGASSAAAAAYLQGEQPTVRGVYGRALRALPTIVGASLIALVLLLLLFLASIVLFVVTLFGTLGTLIALVGLIWWWRKPASRRPWLKWLIILTTPLGLFTYFSVRWYLYVPAIILEGQGPISSIGRSSRLVEHEWFRTAAVLTVAGLVVAVLIAVPLLMVGMVLGVLGLSGAFADPDPTGTLVTNTASVVTQVLVSSLGSVAYVLLFVDLRNRREGTDIGQRISSLEATGVVR